MRFFGIAYMALAFAALVGCRDAPLPPAGQPTFLTPKRATSMQRMGVQMPLGESLTWSVSYRGMPIGTAALDVRGRAGALEIESRFETIGLADQVRPVRHRLNTSLSKVSAGFEDVHSALGRVRAWARADASPAILEVRHESRMYRVTLAQPLMDHRLSMPTWRIDAEARAEGLRIKMTLWLSADSRRLPLQMTLSQHGDQIQARLLNASAALGMN